MSHGGGCAEAGPGGSSGLVPRGPVHLWRPETGPGGPRQAIPCPNPPRPVPPHHFRPQPTCPNPPRPSHPTTSGPNRPVPTHHDPSHPTTTCPSPPAPPRPASTRRPRSPRGAVCRRGPVPSVPFGGLTSEMAGWRLGIRYGNPPHGTSTHHMGRQPTRCATEPADHLGGSGGRVPRGLVHLWWAGTGRGGPRQAIPCPNPPRPVPTHHDPSQPTKARPNPRPKPTSPDPPRPVPTHQGPSQPTAQAHQPRPTTTCPSPPLPVSVRCCVSARTWCRATPLGGLTSQMVGWRPGIRYGNPPHETSTHQMRKPAAYRLGGAGTWRGQRRRILGRRGAIFGLRAAISSAVTRWSRSEWRRSSG